MNTSINERIKTLFKEKTVAKLDRYENGKLYYIYTVPEGMFEFPIDTVHNVLLERFIDGIEYGIPSIKLSEELGETPFRDEMKASELTRWIKRAALVSELKKL